MERVRKGREKKLSIANDFTTFKHGNRYRNLPSFLPFFRDIRGEREGRKDLL